MNRHYKAPRISPVIELLYLTLVDLPLFPIRYDAKHMIDRVTSPTIPLVRNSVKFDTIPHRAVRNSVKFETIPHRGLVLDITRSNTNHPIESLTECQILCVCNVISPS